MKLAYALIAATLALAGCGKINLKCGTLEECAGICKDTQTDNDNCGACSNKCGPGQTCVAGACGGCPTGTKACGGTCADVQLDNQNCGDCGVVCSGGMVCNTGVCACTAPMSDCSGACVDTKTDTNNCGMCGTICDPGKSCVSGSCVCVAPNMTCGNLCIDPTSNSSNCNGCGNVCMGGKTCQSSMCKCVSPQTECSGSCFSTVTDRNHCGAGCSVCAAGQVCNNGCTPAPVPTMVTRPADPTGWKDPAGQDIKFTFADTGVPGTIYECRTGPDAIFTPTVPAWANCDGGGGTTPTHKPAPLLTTPEGNYRTEYRYRADTYTSAVVQHFYYVHHSLDSVPTCPTVASNEPKSTDAQYFAAAQTFATANPTLFPTTSTFAAPTNPPVRSDSTYLRNPFIKITFVGIQHTTGMDRGLPNATPYPAAGGTYVMNELSLRHRWVMNAGRTMILMKRSFLNNKKTHPTDPVRADCRNTFVFGSPAGNVLGPISQRGQHRRVDCEAFVVNVRGDGLCLGGPAGAPTTIAIDANPAALAPANEAGTISLTAGSTTVTGSGTAFVAGMVGTHMLPAAAGHWYTITAVASATSMTINQGALGTQAAVTWKRATTAQMASFRTPTGYTKFHDMPHSEAQATKNPKWPSSNSKCITSGCDAGSPWLIYLPP